MIEINNFSSKMHPSPLPPKKGTKDFVRIHNIFGKKNNMYKITDTILDQYFAMTFRRSRMLTAHLACMVTKS